mmetsp:Transcript_107157/g.311170  ORF Transcript_107157/g.311170 Transcript_107157/m.311170 type:complete len:233 (-) Transcript_107157:1158-1856(-)
MLHGDCGLLGIDSGLFAGDVLERPTARDPAPCRSHLGRPAGHDRVYVARAQCHRLQTRCAAAVSTTTSHFSLHLNHRHRHYHYHCHYRCHYHCHQTTSDATTMISGHRPLAAYCDALLRGRCCFFVSYQSAKFGHELLRSHHRDQTLPRNATVALTPLTPSNPRYVVLATTVLAIYWLGRPNHAGSATDGESTDGKGAAGVAPFTADYLEWSDLLPPWYAQGHVSSAEMVES